MGQKQTQHSLLREQNHSEWEAVFIGTKSVYVLGLQPNILQNN
ncbi:hypothetical protein VCR15J5_30362 [Vibrio crassostreae]|nr:hypothetical protein VCR15J5_30362 [Vibrio crassostreae]